MTAFSSPSVGERRYDAQVRTIAGKWKYNGVMSKKHVDTHDFYLYI